MEMNEELIKRKIVMEMIIDKLFESLKKGYKQGKECIYVESYKIDESQMTYLLRKYDEERFRTYEELLLNESEEE